MLVNDPSLTPEEQRLRDLMSEISEASYYACWMRDTEFEVWRLATEGGVWGRSTAAELQQALEMISALAQNLGKWIVWREWSWFGQPGRQPGRVEACLRRLESGSEVALLPAVPPVEVRPHAPGRVMGFSRLGCASSPKP